MKMLVNGTRFNFEGIEGIAQMANVVKASPGGAH
jgi:hypothetical protein